jgi:multidrug efflux pump subunit AcrA (membrane-fusion protein)
VGALAIAGHRYDVVTVPAGAVLRSPEGAFLFVVSADGRAFARRSIDVGRTIVGLATVLAGLDEGERVVVSGGEWLAAQQAMGETTQDLVPPGSPKAVGP